MHSQLLDDAVLDLMNEHGIKLSAKQVLDVACGQGEWCWLLRSCFDRSLSKFYIVGLDIWNPYLRKVKNFHIYDIIESDATLLPFQDDSFDIVLLDLKCIIFW